MSTEKVSQEEIDKLAKAEDEAGIIDQLIALSPDSPLLRDDKAPDEK